MPATSLPPRNKPCPALAGRATEHAPEGGSASRPRSIWTMSSSIETLVRCEIPGAGLAARGARGGGRLVAATGPRSGGAHNQPEAAQDACEDPSVQFESVHYTDSEEQGGTGTGISTSTSTSVAQRQRQGQGTVRPSCPPPAEHAQQPCRSSTQVPPTGQEVSFVGSVLCWEERAVALAPAGAPRAL